MPVEVSDIVALPYDDQYSLAGVQYARDSLHYTYNRMGLQSDARLRKIVAGVAFEMAFRRWLEAGQVPYDLLGATHFTERDRYDIGLGGRRCDLKGFLIRDKRTIRAVNADPAWLLDASALVPLDQIVSTHLGPKDIYIFGFLSGLEARGIDDSRRALAKGAPAYLLYTLSARKWVRRRDWHSLGCLALKSSGRDPIEVEIGGLGRDRDTVREVVSLEPRVRTTAQQDYYSVLYLRVDEVPGGDIGLHSPALNSTPVVAPHDWKNIWLYGQRVYLCGWMNKQEFRRKSSRLLPGSRTKQYARTQTVNRALPVSALRPMRHLAELTKQSGWR